MTTDEQNSCFERWAREHGAVLHHVANGFAAGTDRHDLMQELLLALWRAVPAFRHSSQSSTFVYRVAHNAALTWKRTQRHYRNRVDQFEAFTRVLPPDSPANDSHECEKLELLYGAIRELVPLDRSLILLHLDAAGGG